MERREIVEKGANAVGCILMAAGGAIISDALGYERTMAALSFGVVLVLAWAVTRRIEPPASATPDIGNGSLPRNEALPGCGKPEPKLGIGDLQVDLRALLEENRELRRTRSELAEEADGEEWKRKHVETWYEPQPALNPRAAIVCRCKCHNGGVHVDGIGVSVTDPIAAVTACANCRADHTAALQ